MAALPNLPIPDWLQQGRSGIKINPAQGRDGRATNISFHLSTFYYKFGRRASYLSTDGSVNYCFRWATVEVLYI
jgi:hypothetical protein